MHRKTKKCSNQPTYKDYCYKCKSYSCHSGKNHCEHNDSCKSPHSPKTLRCAQNSTSVCRLYCRCKCTTTTTCDNKCSNKLTSKDYCHKCNSYSCHHIQNHCGHNESCICQPHCGCQYTTTSTCDKEKECVVGEYDFVIVGGGTAGCVLARRLSEQAGVTVCVIESGNDCTRIPPEQQDLPVTDPTVLDAELTNKTNQWSKLVRKGIFAWHDSLQQGFHSWQWLPRFREESNSRGCYGSRGSDLGGSTQHAQIWIRSDTNEYDKWVALGNTSWDKQTMRELTKRMENRSQTNKNGNPFFNPAITTGDGFGLDTTTGGYGTTPGVHGTDGPVDVICPGDANNYPANVFIPPFAKATMESWSDLPNPDFNLQNPGILGSKRLADDCHPLWENKRVAFPSVLTDLDQLGSDFANRNSYGDNGVAYPPGTPFGFEGVISDFQRVSAASAYIYPIQNSRPNLTIKTKTYVTKICFDGNKKATGVEILEDGYNVLDCGRNRNTALAGYGGTPLDARYNAAKAKRAGYKIIKAKKEVIVCGGTFNSPHILMLSGVGPRKHLEDNDISVVADIPGVGQNYVDHAEVDYFWDADDIQFDAFSLGAGVNGTYSSFPTTRLRCLKNHPPGHALAGQEITDYDAHVHHEVGLSFALNSGGIVNWNDGRLNIRQVGPPTYLDNRNNVEVQLPQEKDYRSVGWALIEHQKYVDSKGEVRLRSCDPCQAPEIIANWLVAETDQLRFVGGFYNNLWPMIEHLRNHDYILDPTNTGGLDLGSGPTIDPPETISKGSGSWFKEWLWPSLDTFTDTLNLPTDAFTGNGSSVVIVTHPAHGLEDRYNGLTENNKHYVRFMDVDPLDGNDVNRLYYVTIIDNDNYSFDLSEYNDGTTASAGTHGGDSATARFFNYDNYIDFCLKYCWGHHASGTCKMGPVGDPMAVVDQRCRVYKVSGLRVVDCSISPIIHAANTQTAAYVYGERVSDMIKADHPALYPMPEFP